MKKKIISKNGIKILAATACLAVVGTASAAWSFAKDVAKTDTLGTTIEGYSEIGNIEITGCSNVKLNLDSNRSTTSNGDGISWRNADGEIAYGDASDIAADYKELGDNQSGATTMIRKYTITLDDKLFEYIKFVAGSGDTTQNDAVVDGSEGKSVSGTWVDNTAIKLPKVAWQEDKCPKTSKQYNTMLTELGFTATTSGSRDVATDDAGGEYVSETVAGDNA